MAGAKAPARSRQSDADLVQGTEEQVAEQEGGLADESAAAAGLAEAIEKGQIASSVREGLRAFLCPQQPEGAFLIQAGKLVQFRDPNSPTGSRDARRDGDIMAEFHGGMLVTDDPVIIEWCDAHGPDRDRHAEYHLAKGQEVRLCRAGAGLCLEASHPAASVWVEFKTAQIPTSRRDAVIAGGTDVDGLVAGRGMQGPASEASQRLVKTAKQATQPRE